MEPRSQCLSSESFERHSYGAIATEPKDATPRARQPGWNPNHRTNFPTPTHRPDTFPIPPPASSRLRDRWPRDLSRFCVWGDNTDAGKTLVSAALARAAVRRGRPCLYVKPVQTGWPRDSDAARVAGAAGAMPHWAGPHAAAAARRGLGEASSDDGGYGGASTPPPPPPGPHRAETLFAWRLAASPHLAARREGGAVGDRVLAATVAGRLSAFAAEVASSSAPSAAPLGLSPPLRPLALVETAGSPLSPSPAGRGSALSDALRPLRLPALLVSGGRLGGVGSALAAAEALEARGFDVAAVVVLESGPTDPVSRSWGSRGEEGEEGGGEGCLDNAGAVAEALRRRTAGGLRAPLPGGAEGSSAWGGAAGGTRVLRLPPAPEAPPVAPAEREKAAASLTDADASLPAPRAPDAALERWLDDVAPAAAALLDHLDEWDEGRRGALAALPRRAAKSLWWPFTQHGGAPHVPPPATSASTSPSCGEVAPVAATDVLAARATVVDSRCGDRWTVAREGGSGAGDGATESESFDACCSWWTAGLGDGSEGGDSTLPLPPSQGQVAASLGYAAARWGHILLPEVASEAPVAAAETLLSLVAPPPGASGGLSSESPGREIGGHRVFWSDDGSTAVEVALKMAMRLRAHRQWKAAAEGGGTTSPVWGPAGGYDLLACDGGYHGDTLGCMDATPPSVYTDRQTPWYRPRGLFLDPPTLALRDGRWTVSWPTGARGEGDDASSLVDDLGSDRDAAFHPARRSTALAARYRDSIRAACDAHEASAASPGSSKRPLGVLLFEPLLQGAAGMRLVDPLFHFTLADEARRRGLPVVADEVFSGLYRCGVPSACRDLLGIEPDVSCWAKLLTAGTVPLAATVASPETFAAFWSDGSEGVGVAGPGADDDAGSPARARAVGRALLHGHSYAGHPVGCQAALVALGTLSDPARNRNLGPRPATGAWAPGAEAPAGRAGAAEGGHGGWWDGTYPCARLSDGEAAAAGPGAAPPGPGGGRCARALEGACPCAAGATRLVEPWCPRDAAALSLHPGVEHVVHIGTVLAAHLAPSPGGGEGYAAASPAGAVAAGLRARGAYARPIGSCVYVMTSPLADPAEGRRLQVALVEEIHRHCVGD